MREKADVRARILAARDALAPLEAEARSRAIHARILDLPEYQRAARLSCYVSIRSEVATTALIARALADGKRVAIPRIPRASFDLELVEVDSLDGLVGGPMGIPEPPPGAGTVLPASAMDLHLVPGVAFDATGGRLGYGRGYYDRLLAGARSPAFGLAFDLQVVPALPREAHDAPVNGVVTETRVLRV